MTNTLLAFGTFSVWEVISLIVFAIPAVVAIAFIRLLLRNKKENIRLRLEVGKLAHELEQTRKQKSNEGGDSQAGP